jgi:predicted ABC-class ATPase
MGGEGWMAATGRIVAGAGEGIDRRRLREGTNAYCVRSPDGSSLQFAMPLLIPRPLPDGIDPRGADGAAWAIIEAVKKTAGTETRLRPIGGLDTERPARYAGGIEPVTLVHSDAAIGSELWRPDSENIFQPDGLHCTVRGAVPYPGQPDGGAIREIAETVAALAEGIVEVMRRVPVDDLAAAATLSLDQKLLRARLPSMGLVCFIGDGTLPARSYTRFRQHHRVAGPKEGVHIPFLCPDDLGPIEIELPASGRRVVGLGIRRREVLAVAGSNAQGKSTLLNAIRAGEDDHAEGDGRELVVTVRGARAAEAGGQYLGGADVSLFFRSLPPGMTGTPKSAFGQGSGSMTMAVQVAAAVREGAPLLLIDEDRAAANLLVGSTLQEEDVTPLAEILAERPEALRDTACIVATSSLDPLIARADRILVLRGHGAGAISGAAFRAAYLAHLERCAETIKKDLQW